MSFWSVGNAVRQTSDGGYIVAGWTGPNESTRDVLLFKTNAVGDSLLALFAVPLRARRPPCRACCSM